MAGNDDYLETTVQIPRDRYAEFHLWLGQWLAGSAPPAKTGGRMGWADGDVTAAVRLYEGISPKATRILDLWMGSPGEWFTSQATAEAADLPGPLGVAGSLSSIGKAAARLGRELPFEWKPAEAGGQGTYRMPEPVADLFRQARARVRPDD